MKIFSDYLFCLLIVISCVRAILHSGDLESGQVPTLGMENVFTVLLTQDDARFGFTRGMHSACNIVNALFCPQVMKVFRWHTVDVDRISNEEIFYKNHWDEFTCYQQMNWQSQLLCEILISSL